MYTCKTEGGLVLYFENDDLPSLNKRSIFYYKYSKLQLSYNDEMIMRQSLGLVHINFIASNELMKSAVYKLNTN